MELGDLPHRSRFRVGVNLLFRVIAAADEWTRFDVMDPPVFSALFPHREFIGVDPADHREVLGCRLEILAQREDVAADGDQVVEHRVDLMLFLTQAEHHARLGDEALTLGDLKESQ